MHSCWNEEDKLLISVLYISSWSGHDKVHSPTLTVPVLLCLTLSVISGLRSVLKGGCHAKLSFQSLSPPSWFWWAGAFPSHCLPVPLHCRHACEISTVLTSKAMSGSDSLYQLKLCFFLESRHLAPLLVTGV